MVLKNDRFLRAILRKPIDRTPIWVMRQAGRYLPEYREVRKKAGSFMKLCQTPELATEVTLQPLARFDLDAAIIFSDILTIPDAMGLELNFIEGEGPCFFKTLNQERDIKSLTPPDLNDLKYVYDAIALVKPELKVPLIGFCGSPFTLALYMLEGRSQPSFPRAFQWLRAEPRLFHDLLAVLAKSVALHLNAQIEAGADAVMIFDSWGGLLSDEQYPIYSLHYIKIILSLVKSAHPATPIILFTKGGSRWVKEMAESGCDVLGLDWTISLGEARANTADKVALQGNMNPAVLLESENTIEQTAAAILASYGKGSGHIFNLGHGITPDVPPHHMNCLIEAVHRFSPFYHEA